MIQSHLKEKLSQEMISWLEIWKETFIDRRWFPSQSLFPRSQLTIRLGWLVTAWLHWFCAISATVRCTPITLGHIWSLEIYMYQLLIFKSIFYVMWVFTWHLISMHAYLNTFIAMWATNNKQAFDTLCDNVTLTTSLVWPMIRSVFGERKPLLIHCQIKHRELYNKT